MICLKYYLMSHMQKSLKNRAFYLMTKLNSQAIKANFIKLKKSTKNHYIDLLNKATSHLTSTPELKNLQKLSHLLRLALIVKMILTSQISKTLTYCYLKK